MPSADFALDGGLVLVGLKLRARKSEVGKHHFENIGPGNVAPPDLHAAQRTRRLGAASPVTGTGDNTLIWTNTAGRSIQAQFVRVEGANVLLRMDGREIPVPVSSLSASSIQQAQALEQKRTR